jgi:DnaJ-class molecular chaperone
MGIEHNLYKFLTVDESADALIIRYAYQFLVAIYHPGNEATGDHEKFKRLNDAWQVLSDEGKRAAYDQEMQKLTDFDPRNQNGALYQLLQVDSEAHATVIRYAYRYLATMYHPDNAETGDARMFKKITDAWMVLSDEDKRAVYDASLRAARK